MLGLYFDIRFEPGPHTMLGLCFEMGIEPRTSHHARLAFLLLSLQTKTDIFFSKSHLIHLQHQVKHLNYAIKGVKPRDKNKNRN